MTKKKKVISILVIEITTITITIAVAILWYNAANDNIFYNLNKAISINIPEDSTVLSEIDSHGGFHGDGETYAEIMLSDTGMKRFIDYINKSSNWSSLPLPKDICKIIYGGMYDGVSYGTSDIINGFYYVRDRFAERYPEYADIDITSRSSYNVTIAIVDLDTNKLYIYELDT